MSQTVRVDLEPAYVLHARSYRETSQLLEVFTHQHGRLGLVARGARRPKSPYRGLLNPFQPLHISWAGRGELQTLRDAELAGLAVELGGDAVLSGFYLNELLLKFMQRSDPHPQLFALYSQSLADLGAAHSDGSISLEPVLRQFEIGLLAEAGYALNLATDAINHEPLQADCVYEFLPEQGAVALEAGRASDRMCFAGEQLLAMGRHEFSDPEVARAARRLLRYVINSHLGESGLRTRKVAAAMKR
jgi:DNA repair protein RecO (recombination protein O)